MVKNGERVLIGRSFLAGQEFGGGLLINFFKSTGEMRGCVESHPISCFGYCVS